MTERVWHGIVVVGVFLGGVLAQRAHQPTKSLTIATQASGEAQASAKSQEASASKSIATADDTGTERIERKVVKPDGTVATTLTTRDYRWRRMAQAEEKQEKKVEIQYVDRWQTKTELKLVEKLREPDWSITVLGGVAVTDPTTPIAAVQVSKRLFLSLDATVQVQKGFAPGKGALDDLVFLAGLTWRIP